MIGRTKNAHAQAVEQVREYMRSRKLTLTDLIEIGGEDLRGGPLRKRALHVEKCWALMARLEVKHVDLGDFEPLTVPLPGSAARRRRDRDVATGKFNKNKNMTLRDGGAINTSKNSGLAISSPVGEPETKSAEYKREAEA